MQKLWLYRVKKMNVYIDYREQKNHPQITELLDSYGFNTIIKSLEIGDFICNGVIIEHKTAEDYGKSIKNKLLFQQCHDMKANSDMDCYVLVSARIKDILRMENPMKQNALFASIASIQERGVQIMFLESEDFVANQMRYLFTKHHDGKNRNINPVRKAVSKKDVIINNYMTLPGVDIVLAERLYKRFPIPDLLYTAMPSELQKVDGIGEKIANKIVEFCQGCHIVTKEEVLKEVAEIEKENNMKIEEMIRVDPDRFDFHTNVVISNYKLLILGE